MPADANAITLTDYALMSNDPLVTRVTKSLLINGSVMTDIPLLSKKSLLVNGIRWEGNLPTVSWNKLNEGPTTTKGKPSPYQEQLFLMRNNIDTDVKLLEDENQIADPRALQLDAYLQSVSFDFNDKFINNDPVAGDSDSFVGLRYRLDNPTIYGVNSEVKINGAGVDLTTSMTAATANQFIENVQQMLDYMGRPDGDGVVFYCNDTLKRRWERAIRVMGAGSGWNMTRDAFDRAITTYKNARVQDIGRTADQSTRIITNTETSAGLAGASTYTSLYAVCYGDERMIGWQFDPLGSSIKDLGLIGGDGTIYRVLIDWAVGLLPMHTRCFARQYGIKLS